MADRAYKADMRQCLRKVPELLAGLCVDLLRVKTKVATIRQDMIEFFARLPDAAQQDVIVDEP